jgi:aldehyde:ferredoxin oxidoreductase
MKGYAGKILHVNLTEGEISVERPPEEFYKRYLGGRGFIIRILLSRLKKGIDPLGPENILVFALGPVTGNPLTGSGRNSIGAKSPMSGGFGESEAGGYWGAKLKLAGFDAIIVMGRSKRPVYLFIDNGDARILEAGHLWGLEVAEAQNAIRKQLGDKQICTSAIGRGGENLVRYACIVNDLKHLAGRTGLGAVMGSKNLKAIAVRGNRQPELAHREEILEMSRWMNQNRDKAHVCEYGTGSAMLQYEATGNMPVRNFNGGRFPGVERIKPHSMFEKNYIQKMGTCFGCPIRCKRVVAMDTPWRVDPAYGAPEYETLAALGSNCGIENLESIIKANELCNRHGIDTISTGVSISFAMECYEKGILTSLDTDGLELNFGNYPAMLELVERIALREGLGNLLADGTRRAADKIGKGSSKFAMHVKGIEIPMHEPRYKQGMGLLYSVNAAGPDHNSSMHDNLFSRYAADWESVDFADELPPTELSPRKARMLYHVATWRQMGNYLGVCNHVPWSNRQLTDAMEYITGWPMSYWKLMKGVERGITLTRIFNIREGLTQEDDVLPDRFASALTEGPLKGIVVDPKRLANAQKVYYQMLGWDESGRPTEGRMVELGIEWAMDYIANIC